MSTMIAEPNSSHFIVDGQCQNCGARLSDAEIRSGCQRSLDQAAEIKRLKAERDGLLQNHKRLNAQRAEADTKAADYLSKWTEAEAQLAAMRDVLEHVNEMLKHWVVSNSSDDPVILDLQFPIAEALATDAGKAAADVLEYAIKYVTGEHKGTTGLWSKVQVYLGQQRAYRNEGRDDG